MHMTVHRLDGILKLRLVGSIKLASELLVIDGVAEDVNVCRRHSSRMCMRRRKWQEKSQEECQH